MIIEDIWRMNTTTAHAICTERWTIIDAWLLQMNTISKIHVIVVDIPFIKIPTVIHLRTTNLAIITIHFGYTNISNEPI